VSIVLVAAVGLAQNGSSDEGKRKIKSRTNPVYPEMARRMNIAGRVRIEVVITPEGRVKSSRALGGHPVLVQACQDAVKEWRFVAAQEQSTQVYEFDFGTVKN
jgi:TonB family protein